MVPPLHQARVQIQFLVPADSLRHHHSRLDKLWCEVQTVLELYKVWTRTGTVTEDGHGPGGHRELPTVHHGSVLREKETRRLSQAQGGQDQEDRGQLSQIRGEAHY